MLNLENIFNNKLFFILCICLLIFFILIGIYYYNSLVKPNLNPSYVDNKEFINKDDSQNNNDDTTLYFFFTTWCPHCKTARPHWDNLIKNTGGVINTTKITFKEIDCDLDTEAADKFNITGYPTIKLFYNNKIYDYDAKPNTETLTLFLNTIIN